MRTLRSDNSHYLPGAGPLLEGLHDARAAAVALGSGVHSVSPDEAARAYREGAVFVDVRSSVEHARDGLSASLNLPLDAIQAGAEPTGVGKDQPLYLVCERGLLSELAGLYLEHAGFASVVNVRGGLGALRAAL